MPKKRSPSKAVTVTVATPKLKLRHRVGSDEVIRQSEVAFLQDPDGQTIEWHWKNGVACKYVSLATFHNWAQSGKWIDRRIEYWRQIQDRLLDNLSDKILDQRIAELKDMKAVRDAIVEMLQPMQDKNGNILRDEAGLPKFHVTLPPYDRLVRAFIELDTRMGVKGGDVTDRIAIVDGRASRTTVVTGGRAQELLKLTTEEAQHLARQLLLKRNNRLHDEDVIDMEEEDGD